MSTHNSQPRRFERRDFLPFLLLAVSFAYLALAMLVAAILRSVFGQLDSARGEMIGGVLIRVWLVLLAATWFCTYLVTVHITIRKRFVFDGMAAAMLLLIAFVVLPVGLIAYLVVLFWKPVSENEYLAELGERLQSGSFAERADARDRLEEPKDAEYSLSQLASRIFTSKLSSKDDDPLVSQAHSLSAQGKHQEALRVIQGGLASCKRKDRLCALMANVHLYRKDPLAIGWWMQCCILANDHWLPYLLLSAAARGIGLQDLSWRCLNACDIIDASMKRMDRLAWDVVELAGEANRSELLDAMKRFEVTMGPDLPLPNDLPHEDEDRSIELLRNECFAVADPGNETLRLRLRLHRKRQVGHR